MKQWIIGGIIILVLIASYLWNRNNSQVEETVPAEEILVQEDGTTVKKVGDSIEVLSEEEVTAQRQQADDKLSGVAPAALSAVEGKAGSGQSSRVFVDGQYYQKLVLTGLPAVQKGYYYEAWLKNANGQLNSIGRVDSSSGQGILYYQSKEDKSVFSSVVVSYEIEDGNSAISEIVLEGSH